jgi:hypothetical protein
MLWYNQNENLFVAVDYGTGDNLLPEDIDDGYTGYTVFGSFYGPDGLDFDDMEIDPDYTEDELYVNDEECEHIDGGMLLYRREPMIDTYKYFKEVLYQLNLDEKKVEDWEIVRE